MSRSRERRTSEIQAGLEGLQSMSGAHTARDVFTNTVDTVSDKDAGYELTRQNQCSRVRPHHFWCFDDSTYNALSARGSPHFDLLCRSCSHTTRLVLTQVLQTRSKCRHPRATNAVCTSSCNCTKNCGLTLDRWFCRVSSQPGQCELPPTLDRFRVASETMRRTHYFHSC